MSQIAPRHHSASTTRSGAMIVTAPSVQESSKLAAASHKMENNYRLAPERVFPSTSIRTAIEDVLATELADREYDPARSSQWATELANSLKAKFRDMGFARYRLVTYVVLGQRDQATISLASRCVWNAALDTFVEGRYVNKTMYAAGLVFAVYQE